MEMSFFYICQNDLRIVCVKIDDICYSFHTIWLRHNCRCELECLHSTTKEIIVCPSTWTNNEITPLTINCQNNILNIIWMDHHQSQYTIEWLLEYKHCACQNIDVIHSNFNIKPNKSVFEWTENNNLHEQLEQMQFVMSKVKQEGYCHIKKFGIDNQKLIDLMNKCGYPLFGTHFGPYENLEPAKYNTFNKHTDQLGYTQDRIDLHTDQTYIEDCPKFQSLHCICQSDSGGSNMIIDAKKMYDIMKEFFPMDAIVLSTQPIVFYRKQKEYEKKLETTLIKTDTSGNFQQIRSSYFTLAPFNISFNMIIPYYRAYNRFHELIRREESQINILLESGEIIIYDNHRMMHGRESFEGYRLIKGTYHNDK